LLRAAFASDWLKARMVVDQAAVARLTAGLARVEAEAIVLRGETGAEILLVDDRQARTVARREGLVITGTLGILRMAQSRGLIRAVMPLLEGLRRSGFRISLELMEQIRREEAAR
jgi:predicted nucleic acid-binding protein